MCVRLDPFLRIDVIEGQVGGLVIGGTIALVIVNRLLFMRWLSSQIWRWSVWAWCRVA